jgi:membrane protease YdiL (CAAX protease family)
MIKDLEASDFPGVDKEKFNEWKALRLKDMRRMRIILFLSLPIALILGLIAKSNIWAWQKGGDVDWTVAWFILAGIYIIIVAVYWDMTSKRLQKLGKELQMSARLRALGGGRAFIK